LVNLAAFLDKCSVLNTGLVLLYHNTEYLCNKTDCTNWAWILYSQGNFCCC